MLTLPQTTHVNKKLPKEKFYQKLSVSAELKRAFVEQIKSIAWRYKIASTTMNLAPGEMPSYLVSKQEVVGKYAGGYNCRVELTVSDLVVKGSAEYKFPNKVGFNDPDC